MRARVPVVLLFAGLGVGCLGTLDSGDSEPWESGTAPEGECGRIVGTSGGFLHQTAQVDWEWDDSGGVYVGPVLERTVPDDIVSLGVTVDEGYAWTGFLTFQYAGTEYADAWNEGGQGGWDGPPIFHYPAEGGTIVLPINPESDPSGGGCLVFQPFSWDEPSGQGTVHIVSRRGDSSDRINLNIVMVGNTQLSQSELDAALARATNVWEGGGGPAIGDVQIYEVGGSSTIPFDDKGELLATKIGDDERTVNIFMISDFSDESGTLGVAAGIPGPVAVHGTWGSGVVVGVDSHLDWDGTTLDTQTMGETIAHEVGHQLGLFHTTESDGSRSERLNDTPECPASADVNGDNSYSAEECRSYDGGNFMFWVAGIPQDGLSNTQASVLNNSPVAR
jgi:hypothetical protein